VAATYDCASPLSYFLNAKPYVGIPFDCVAIKKMMAADSQIDVIPHERNGFFPQNYTIRTLAPTVSSDMFFLENMMATTMGDPQFNDGENGYFAAHDLNDMLGDQRVLSATQFDFQPLLNKVVD